MRQLANAAARVFSQQTDSRSLATCCRFCSGWMAAPRNLYVLVPRTCYLMWQMWQEYCVIWWGGASPGLSGWALGTLVGTREWDKQRKTYTEKERGGEVQGEAAANQAMPTALRTRKRQGTCSPFFPTEVDTSTLHSWPPELWENTFCSLKFKVPPSLCYFVTVGNEWTATCTEMPAHLHRWAQPVQSQALSLPMDLVKIHSFLFSARTLVILI